MREGVIFYRKIKYYFCHFLGLPFLSFPSAPPEADGSGNPVSFFYHSRGRPFFYPVPRLRLSASPVAGETSLLVAGGDRLLSGNPEVFSMRVKGFALDYAGARMLLDIIFRRSGETGRRAGLKIPWEQSRGGSTPPSGTIDIGGFANLFYDLLFGALMPLFYP